MDEITTIRHRPPPSAVDEGTSKAGLRAVALFEATKGALVMVLAATLVAVRHRMEDLVEELLYHLHVGFEKHWAQALLRGASDLSDMHVWTVLTFALVYATVRFVEAWGLWHRRVWAEWFALLSGTLYLPFELLKVLEHRGWEAIAVLAVNLCIVLYMAEIRVRAMRAREQVE